MDKNKFKGLLLLVLLYVNPAFSQMFITVDADTQEFIESVDYSLFKNKQVVNKGITLNDTATIIIDFDSISFSRIDYNAVGFAKGNIDSIIWLSKKIIYLDELVVSSERKKQNFLGETNRFVKRTSGPLSNNLSYGTIFKNNFEEKQSLDKITFFC